MIRGIVLLVLGLSSALAGAAEVRQLSVEHRDGRYIMHSVTWFDAPRAGVFDVLTDYDNFDKISSVYRDSRFEPPAADGTTRVYTMIRGCVLFFCQTMRRTERLEADGLGSIRATAESEGSDFSYSLATWALIESAEGTLVTYRIEMEPSFWIPPFVGPYMMKRKLRKGASDVVVRIEKRARASVADAAVFARRGLAGFDTATPQ